MSALPIAFNPLPSRPTFRPRVLSSRRHWLPVVCTLLFICFTSTTLMGGHNTGVVVVAVWKFFFGTHNLKLAWEINFIGRKVGHFFGYGVVGLIFRDAWYKTANSFSLVTKSWLVPFASFLAIVSTFTVASLDEYHQMFLPGRVGRVQDALLDTAGSIFLNLIFCAALAHKRMKKEVSQPSSRQHRVNPCAI